MPSGRHAAQEQHARVRIVFADAQRIVRHAVAASLEAQGRLEIVGHAERGDHLVGVAQEAQAGVVLLNYDLPGLDGASFVRQLRTQAPRTKVVVLDGFPQPMRMKRALFLGAHGYVSLAAPAGEIEEALLAVSAGERYIERAFRTHLKKGSLPHERMPQRQLQVLTMIAQGMTSKQIAYEFGLSPKTIDVHRARLKYRLNLANEAAITLFAMREGLIRP